MGACWFHWSFSLLLMFLLIQQLEANASGCDYFQGMWVYDESFPLYNTSTCPFIEREFDCQRNGRPDQMYPKYRWQPAGCALHRFDGVEFLERMRGKRIMFVGDSLSRNQWQSLTCMLYSSLPSAKYTLIRQDDVSTFTFTDYGVEVMLDRNVYLVDVVKETRGRVLKLDKIEGGKLWKGIDTLIFNTWHWWNRRGPSQRWDYIQVGTQIYKDMDRMVAFERALVTWAGWVDANVDPIKTNLFFQGISPSHYNGTLWSEPRAKGCAAETQPVSGSTYPGGLPPAVTVVKRVLSKMRTPVELLDITTLSLLRKDGHPSKYGLGGQQMGMDCSHWCLAGVPDTWNQILYHLLFFQN